jgi:hypothetical protein
LLRERKLALTGRADLPLDPASVLLGRELIDREQFDKLGEITAWLRIVAKAWGAADGVAGLWLRLLVQ